MNQNELNLAALKWLKNQPHTGRYTFDQGYQKILNRLDESIPYKDLETQLGLNQSKKILNLSGKNNNPYNITKKVNTLLKDFDISNERKKIILESLLDPSTNGAAIQTGNPSEFGLVLKNKNPHLIVHEVPHAVEDTFNNSKEWVGPNSILERANTVERTPSPQDLANLPEYIQNWKDPIAKERWMRMNHIGQPESTERAIQESLNGHFERYGSPEFQSLVDISQGKSPLKPEDVTSFLKKYHGSASPESMAHLGLGTLGALGNVYQYKEGDVPSALANTAALGTGLAGRAIAAPLATAGIALQSEGLNPNEEQELEKYKQTGTYSSPENEDELMKELNARSVGKPFADGGITKAKALKAFEDMMHGNGDLQKIGSGGYSDVYSTPESQYVMKKAGSPEAIPDLYYKGAHSDIFSHIPEIEPSITINSPGYGVANIQRKLTPLNDYLDTHQEMIHNILRDKELRDISNSSKNNKVNDIIESLGDDKLNVNQAANEMIQNLYDKHKLAALDWGSTNTALDEYGRPRIIDTGIVYENEVPLNNYQIKQSPDNDATQKMFRRYAMDPELNEHLIVEPKLNKAVSGSAKLEAMAGLGLGALGALGNAYQYREGDVPSAVTNTTALGAGLAGRAIAAPLATLGMALQSEGLNPNEEQQLNRYKNTGIHSSPENEDELIKEINARSMGKPFAEGGLINNYRLQALKSFRPGGK